MEVEKRRHPETADVSRGALGCVEKRESFNWLGAQGIGRGIKAKSL